MKQISKNYFMLLIAIMCIAACTEIEDIDYTYGLPSEVKTTDNVTVSYYSATIKSYGSYGGRYLTVSENEDLSDPVYDRDMGWGYGSFSEELTDLKSGTTYYYRESVKDSHGYRMYGDVKSFTTKKSVRIEATCSRTSYTSELKVTLYIYDFFGSSKDIGCHFKSSVPTVKYMKWSTQYDLGWHFNTSRTNYYSDNPWVLTMTIPYSEWSNNDFYFQPYMYNADNEIQYGEIEHFTF